MQAGSGARRSNVIHDGFVTIQGLTLPVLADLAEQSVFDRIPFGRAGRVVADRDRDVVRVCQTGLNERLPSS